MSWYDKPTTNPFNPPTEPGIDVATGFHEPITAIQGGQVKDAFYGPFGGVVGLSTYLPGVAAPVEEYFLHLDRIEVAPGQAVQPGQEVGLGGGQLAGGEHPASPASSTGLHTEFGYFAGKLFNSPSIDPTGIINALRAGAPVSGLGGFGLPDPGAAVSGALTGAGHGLANALTAGVDDVATFFKKQIIALAVALIVAIILFA